MLLTTSDGHIHVLDSFRGTLVSFFIFILFFLMFRWLTLLLVCSNCLTCAITCIVYVVIHVQCKTHFKQFNVGGIF